MFWILAFIWTLDFDICHSNPGIVDAVEALSSRIELILQQVIKRLFYGIAEFPIQTPKLIVAKTQELSGFSLIVFCLFESPP
jgi:hypothetical protein